MGGQQSREELVYKEAVEGNSHSLITLHTQGAGLEWVNGEGKTALILACTSPDLFFVAKTLIELGANVNAYRRGRDAGTPLHHAAKRGLLHTVELLLSHGAIVCARNDDGQTPLDVARKEGKLDTVRAIEAHICVFSGWLREFHGPGLLEVLAPQLLSRKIWVVLIPSGLFSCQSPELELVIYPDLLEQNTKPFRVIDLRCADLGEPNFQESDPSLIIYDKSNKTRYRFASGNHGDKQQLQMLYNACKGTHQAVSANLQHDTRTSEPATNNQKTIGWVTSVESRQLLILNNTSGTDANEENGWGNASGDSTQNGWGSLPRPVTSKVSNGWMDGPAKEEYNGWGLFGGPATTEGSSNGGSNEPPKEDYNGWGSLGGPTTSEAKMSSNGWRNEPSKEDQDHNGWGLLGGLRTSEASTSTHGWRDEHYKVDDNGWDAPEPRLSNNTIQHIDTEQTADSSVPSAPPLPNEDFDDDPIQYARPRIDSGLVDISRTYIDKETSRLNEAKGGSASSSLCVICWEAPVEAACVPCGHMAACMSCLNEIKSKQGACPVCRAKIDQVIRIYVSSEA